MSDHKNPFDAACEELDELTERLFKRDGIATLVVAYQLDPLDGRFGTETKRVSFWGGSMLCGELCCQLW